MEAEDGKIRETDVADTNFITYNSIYPLTKGRTIQAMVSEVGTQRLEEIENPEKAMERMRALYEAKGYPQDWIDKRMRGIAIRNDLTTEWEENEAQKRGLSTAILTNEITRLLLVLVFSSIKRLKV